MALLKKALSGILENNNTRRGLLGLGAGIAATVKRNKAMEEAEEQQDLQRAYQASLNTRMATFEGNPDYMELYSQDYLGNPGLNAGYNSSYTKEFDTTPNLRYQMGGMSPMGNPNEPNSLVSPGESFEFPNGEEATLPGNSTPNGNDTIPMNLPSGTQVFSNSLKVPGTNKTFAKEHEKLIKQKEKEEEKLDKSMSKKGPKYTRLAEKTAKYNIKYLEGKINNLFQLQQSLNNNNTGAEGQNPAPPMSMFQWGGQKGGFDLYGGEEANMPTWMPYNQDMNWDATLGDLYDKHPHYRQGMYTSYPMPGAKQTPTADQTMDQANTNWAMEYAQGTLDNLMTDEAEAAMNQSNLNWATNYAQNTLGTNTSTPGTKPKPKGKFSNFMDKAKEYLPTGDELINLSPAIYNMGRAIFEKPLEMDRMYNEDASKYASKLANRKFNINPTLQANQRNYNTAIKNIEELGAATSRGAMMGSISSTMNSKDAADAAAYAQKQNMENQYKGQGYEAGMQAASQNPRLHYMYNDWDARAMQNAEFAGKALTQFSQANQANQLMKNMEKSDAQKLDLLKIIYPYLSVNEEGQVMIDQDWITNYFKPNEQ